jgi:hypothetical protein
LVEHANPAVMRCVHQPVCALQVVKGNQVAAVVTLPVAATGTRIVLLDQRAALRDGARHVVVVLAAVVEVEHRVLAPFAVVPERNAPSTLVSVSSVPLWTRSMHGHEGQIAWVPSRHTALI